MAHDSGTYSACVYGPEIKLVKASGLHYNEVTRCMMASEDHCSPPPPPPPAPPAILIDFQLIFTDFCMIFLFF